MRGLRGTLSVSVDVESHCLWSHRAFYCCCRYEDDSCLGCEIVFDYRSHCFIRLVGRWRTAVATLEVCRWEVWVCGPVLSLPLDHWKREIDVVIYYNKKRGFLQDGQWRKWVEVGRGVPWNERTVLYISTRIGVGVRTVTDPGEGHAPPPPPPPPYLLTKMRLEKNLMRNMASSGASVLPDPVGGSKESVPLSSNFWPPPPPLISGSGWRGLHLIWWAYAASSSILKPLNPLLDAAFCKNVLLALCLLSWIIAGLAVGCLRFNSPIFILNYLFIYLFIVP